MKVVRSRWITGWALPKSTNTVSHWIRRVQNWWWNHVWHHHHFGLYSVDMKTTQTMLALQLPRPSSMVRVDLYGSLSHTLTHMAHNEVKTLVHVSWSFDFTQNIWFHVAGDSIYTSAEVETGVQGLTGPQPDALIWNKWVRAESNKHSLEQCIQPLCSTWRLSSPLLGQFIKEPDWKKKKKNLLRIT